MSLERVFPLSVHVLAALAGWILAVAEGAEGRPLGYASLPVSFVAFLSCELWRKPPLFGFLPNLAGVLALFLASIEFFGSDPQGKLLSGAHLMIYLTWIVLLLEKNESWYWTICALGVLQVAVAAVLTSEGWFGMALILYVGWAIWTLAVFSLFQARQQFLPVLIGAGVGHSPAPVLSSTPNIPSATLHTDQPTTAARRDKQIRTPEIRHAVHHDGTANWLTSRFVGGVSLLTLFSMLMSGLFFLLIPRIWIGSPLSLGADVNDDAIAYKRKSLTGFSPEIKLGDMGTILESVEPVMTVELFDNRRYTDEPMSVQSYAAALGYEEPLFRGNVMEIYDRGKWRGNENYAENERCPRTPTRPGARQRISLESIGTDFLFYMGTVQACELGDASDNAYRHFSTSTLVRGQTPEPRVGKTVYTVYSEIPDGPAPENPGPKTNPAQWFKALFNRQLRLCLDMPQNGLNRLEDYARELVAQAERARGRQLSLLERARLLEAHLRDSGDYGYTLNLTVQDTSIDPVEDFLFNRKEGHCEYFASALALMCRAVDVPSRLVSGFKGGEIGFAGRFVVQQRHAHAWVEAMTETQNWVTLDATPGDARQASVEDVEQSRSTWDRVRDGTTSFWNKYVVDFSVERQHDEFYAPLTDAGGKMLARLKALFENGPPIVQAIGQLLTDPRQWFSLRGLIALIVLGLTGTGIYFAVRLVRRFLLGIRAVSKQTSQRITLTVEFYERLVRTLKQLGFERGIAQTPQEFSSDMAIQLPQADVRRIPLQVVDQFYKVRFGEQQLSEQELVEVDEWLTRFEQGTSEQLPPAPAVSLKP